MRLFLAVEVPGSVRSQLVAAIADVRASHDGLRWTRPEAWHLTLAFLGEVEAHVADRLRGALPVVVAHTVPGPVRLRLTGPGRFGRRVLWYGVGDEPPGTLASLGDQMQRTAIEHGLDVQRRQVRPHLTLARGRGRRVPVTSDVVEDCPVLDAVWRVDRVVLFRSHLGEGPARYEELAAFPFGSA